MAAIFVGLRNLQLAEVTSLAFSAPIWVVVFSIIFLSEKIRTKRWVAVGLGFIGVIIISKPGFDNLNYYYIFPIIFCIGFAGVSIIIRKLTLVGESIWLIAFYFSVVSGVGGLLTFPFGGWMVPNKYDLVLLILIALIVVFFQEMFLILVLYVLNNIEIYHEKVICLIAFVAVLIKQKFF